MENNYQNINSKIQPKGLPELLKEDRSLSQNIPYDEWMGSMKTGVDDTSLDKVYKEYRKTMPNRNHSRSQSK